MTKRAPTTSTKKTAKPAKKVAKTAAKTAAADPDLAKLPPALKKRAEAAERVAHDRILRDARAAFDEARAAMEQAARGYYALGRALLSLKRPGYAEALGYEGGHRALCEEGLGLSKSTVDRLTTAVEHLTAAQYATLRPARVEALLGLAAATPADDTREILEGKVVTLWEGGPTLDVAKASTVALRDAAAEVRDHVARESGKRKRGKTASVEERALAKEAAEKIRAAGSRATAKTRATSPGKASVYDLLGLDAEEFRAAVAAIHKRRETKNG
ncbi:MAG: hypothetical protein U0326_16310 [Polyangiales bacterium]